MSDLDSPRVSRETLGESPAVQEFFGPAYPKVKQFHEMLVAQGELRGLIGPRELERLWERHLLNSAAVVQYLPAKGLIVDLGSGAGLPGIVIASMIPTAQIALIEPMERRCAWLAEVVEELALPNVDIKRGRAEEYHGAFECEAVTARAVANMEKLSRWAFPLLRKGGHLVALKGRQAAAEVESAKKVLRKYGAEDAEIVEAMTVPGVEATTVVRTERTR